MTRIGLASAVLLLLAAAPRPAEARIVELYLQLDPIGGSAGKRLAGLGLGQGETDFFRRNQGGVTGFKLGAEVFYVDVFVDFKQGFGADGWKSAWVGFMAGVDVDFKLDTKGLATGFVGLDAGYGLGTAGPIDPPVDNAKLSQKGPVAQARMGFDYRLAEPLSIGVEIDVGYHYLFLGGAAVANSVDNQEQGVHFMGLLDLKLAFGSSM